MFIALIGCHEENSNDNNSESQVFIVPNPEKVYSFSSLDGSQPYQEFDFNFVTKDLNEIKSNNRGPNTHAKGKFTGFTPTPSNPDPFYKSMSINFNAVDNPQGTHGNANFKRTWGDNGEFVWKFKASAEQIFADENEAVYCGLVFQESGPRPLNLLGAKIWFRVIDGNNSEEDQYYNLILWNPSGDIPCYDYAPNGPGDFIWALYTPRDLENEYDFITIN